MNSVTTWYVVHTQPNAERKAISHLQRQGFSTYLPVYRKQRRHSRRTEVVIAPLFPRYLFVAIDRAVQGWRCIQSTVGVSRLVCNGDEPAPIANRVIEELRAREDEQGLVRIAQRKFVQGEKVKVADGTFSSCVGLFERASDNERVAILLDLLGRKVRVILGLDELTAA